MDQKKVNTERLEKKLNRISLRMQRGSIDALYEMKNLLDYDIPGFQWVETSRKIKPRVFSVMWLLDMVITELWSNLGEDSSGFPKKEGLPYIREISKNLGRFVKQALSTEHEEGMRPFCQAVTKVFELFRLVNDRLMREGIKSDEEWQVL